VEENEFAGGREKKLREKRLVNFNSKILEPNSHIGHKNLE
jgi:hypothetical protein